MKAAATLRRVAPGTYRSADGWRAERVSSEARAAGYGAGWHLIDPGDEYVQTYRTLDDARDGLAAIRASAR